MPCTQTIDKYILQISLLYLSDTALPMSYKRFLSTYNMEIST